MVIFWNDSYLTVNYVTAYLFNYLTSERVHYLIIYLLKLDNLTIQLLPNNYLTIHLFN